MCLAFVLTAALLLGISVFAVADTYQTVNVAPGMSAQTQTQPVWDWLQTNWAIIALVISEGAALLPTKFNGIIQGVVRMFSALFQKK